MKDVREMRNMLSAMQNGELTISRGMELLDMWLVGNYNDGMLPPAREGLGEDEMPWDRIDAVTKQRDELLAALAELVALKDLKDQAYRIDDEAAALSGHDDYLRRKPWAWEAARVVLRRYAK